MSESNAFADETAAAWRDEVQSQRDSDRHMIPTEVPPQLTPYCSSCQRGTTGHLCGPCQRDRDWLARERNEEWFK